MSSTTPISEHEHFFIPKRPSALINRILVRSEVGLQRRSTYKLPPETHAFGKPGDKGDKESAGAST